MLREHYIIRESTSCGSAFCRSFCWHLPRAVETTGIQYCQPAAGLHAERGTGQRGRPVFFARLRIRHLLHSRGNRFEHAEGRGSPALRLRVASANPRATISGVDELPSKSNYLMGQSPAQWHTGVPNFGKVMYKEILPGIDLIYYGRGRRLEYDFRVAPHADPKAIEMRIAWQGMVRTRNSVGDLDIAGAEWIGRLCAAGRLPDRRGRPPARGESELRVESGGGFGFILAATIATANWSSIRFWSIRPITVASSTRLCKGSRSIPKGMPTSRDIHSRVTCRPLPAVSGPVRRSNPMAGA